MEAEATVGIKSSRGQIWKEPAMSTYLRIKEHLDRNRANALNRSHIERIRVAVNVAVLSNAKAEIEAMFCTQYMKRYNINN